MSSTDRDESFAQPKADDQPAKPQGASPWVAAGLTTLVFAVSGGLVWLSQADSDPTPSAREQMLDVPIAKGAEPICVERHTRGGCRRYMTAKDAEALAVANANRR